MVCALKYREENDKEGGRARWKRAITPREVDIVLEKELFDMNPKRISL